MKNYLINEKELKKLLTSHLTLMALNAGGVDNWIWYYDSLNDFIERWVKDNNLNFEDVDYDIGDIVKDYLNFYEVKEE